MSDLRVFRDPRSVAVVGASEDPSKWGNWLARGALRGVGRREVYLINRRGEPVLGQPVAPSLSALPEVPELVAFAVPAPALPAAIDEALELGVRGLVAITADVANSTVLAERARAAGARLIGPNCLGIFDATSELLLAWGEFMPGRLAIVSQSGQIGSELASLAAQAGIGVSRFVSVGEQADVTAPEVLHDLVDHDATRVVAVYLESFGDGAAFLAAVAALRAAGKPTLVLTVGTSRAAQDAALTHTGALTTSMGVVDAACRSVGAVRVDTPAELVDTAQLLSRVGSVGGRRIAVVGDSGGQGALAADVASAAGLDVVRLPDSIQQELRRTLPSHAAVANPIDLAGAGEHDLMSYPRTITALAEPSAVDAVLLTGYFGSYGRDTPALADAELVAAKGICAAGIPVAVHAMAAGTATTEALRDGGVPTFQTIESAVRALRAAAELSDAQAERRADATGRPVDAVLPPIGTGYLAARRLLEGIGVAFPRCRPVVAASDVPAAVADLQAPYVLKADWLAHKTEAGGIATGLVTIDEVAAALADMRARLGDGQYVLEEMDTRADVIELIVGAQRDPSFGPLVLVGAGGVRAELEPDTALELAGIDVAAARRMIRRLRCFPLLDGWRGRPPVDLDAVADVIVRLGRLMVDRADISSLELNPVRVAPDGLLAVDALVTAR